MEQDLLRRIEELERWRTEREKQQISFPLDSQSVNLLKSAIIRYVTGKVTISTGGDSRTYIRGANLNSVPMITHSDMNGTFAGEANIVPSTSVANGYDLLIQGTATDEVWYVVFINPPFIDETP